MIGVGIDFGSRVSAAAVVRDGEPALIPSAERADFGGKSFPTCVALTFDERILVGEAARLQAAENPEGTTAEIKGRLGSQQFVTLRGRSFSPERLAGFVLEKIRRDAGAFLGAPVTRATIGVPTDFDAAQRAAMSAAAEIAGFSRSALIEEPVAAALGHGIDRRRAAKPAWALVVDLGGRGLQVASVEFRDNGPQCMTIVRRPELSVAALDALVFGDLARKFALASGVAIDTDPDAEARLRRAVELARIELGAGRTDKIELGVLAKLGTRQQEVAIRLGRSELDRLLQPMLQRCGAAIRDGMRTAAVAPSAVDHLVLVGGVMRMPELRGLVEEVVGRTAETAVDPSAAVAVGAARHAAGEARSAVPDGPGAAAGRAG